MRFAFQLLALITLISPLPVLATESAVILMYHRFDEQRYPATNIRADQLRQHLDYLKANNFAVLPLAEVLTKLRKGESLTEKTVVITIDDAYNSVYETAFPLFKEYGYPFSVFVSVGPIDNGLRGFMTWNQMREMQSSGVAFFNHGTSHDYLIRMLPGESNNQWQARIHKDIENAQHRLEEELNIQARLFAYPYGEYNEALRALVMDLGYTAFGQHSGAAGSYSDLGALPRFPINEAFGEINGFIDKVNSLALPVANATPLDPVIKTANPPILKLELVGKKRLKLALSCFSTGNAPMQIQREKNLLIVQSLKPMPKGRSRYNCTAPSGERGRYYWYSHLWILDSGSR